MFQLRTLLSAAAAVGIGGAAFVVGQPPVAPTNAPVAANPDEAALRATLAAYGTAYRANDIEKILSFWADDAEFVDDEGGVIKGKNAIGKEFREQMAEAGRETFHAKISSIRFLRGDLAMVDGEAIINPPNEAPEKNEFHSLWSKSNGQWKILSVRDLTPSEDESTPENVMHLRPLDRLVGEWLFKDGDTEITMKVRKSNKGCFLIAEQSVKLKGDESLANTIVIGWDPIEQQIRSWVFDSAGGFGEGRWQRHGNAWSVDSTGVRSDGRSASGVNTWHLIDDDTVVWSATDREIDGELLPDTSARYVRQHVKK